MNTHKGWRLLAFFMIVPTFIACHDNNDLTKSIAEDADTQKIIAAGNLNVDDNGTRHTLYLKATGKPWVTRVGNRSDEDTLPWCKATTNNGDNNTTIDITIEANTSILPRNTTLQISNGKQVISIKVHQEARKQMIPQRQHIDITSNEGDAFIIMETNVMPKPEIPENVSWLKYIDFQVLETRAIDQSPKIMAFHFKAERNEDWGRMATIEFSADGASGVVVNIHQDCRPLKTEETLHIDGPGMLGVMLGNNATNWANMQSLTLSGKLNSADMQALRTLLCPTVEYTVTNAQGTSSLATSVNLNVIHLDMKDCSIVDWPGKYNEPGIKAGLDSYSNSGPNRFGDGVFNIKHAPLASITLPDNLESMGGWAFYYNEHLTRIEIPASVRHIGPYAFFNCQQLTQVVIPNDSQLETLGANCFSTEKRIEELYFPASLQFTKGSSVMGIFRAEEIHVKWPVPPAIRPYGVNNTTIVYVPSGSGDAYRQAEGWGHAKEIIEE